MTLTISALNHPPCASNQLHLLLDDMGFLCCGLRIHQFPYTYSPPNNSPLQCYEVLSSPLQMETLV